MSSSVAENTIADTGDLIRLKWSVTTADGKPLPEKNQVFDQGECRLVLGDGGFLPCLHSTVLGMKPGEKKEELVPPAQAFGEKKPDMGPVEIPASAAPEGLEVGMLVRLVTGATARVTDMNHETVTIDANDPMAGETLKLSVEVLSVDSGATSLELADFAIGCFWGAELAFQREKGVISTKVGYTQGSKENPTYQEVCSGSTGHTECVQVKFDPSETAYSRLCSLFWERLGDSRYLPDQVGNDLFVGRSETEITAMTVFHSQQFAAVLGPASGFLPEFGRLDRRHQHFLSATLVHFFANDSLDLAQGTQAHWQPGV